MPSVNISNYVILEIRYDSSAGQQKFRLFGKHNNGTDSWLHDFEEGTFPISIATDGNGHAILTLDDGVTSSGNFDPIANNSGDSLVAFSEDFTGIPSTGIIGLVDTLPASGGPIRRVKLDASNDALLKFENGSSGWTCGIQYSGSETDDLKVFFTGSAQAFVKAL